MKLEDIEQNYDYYRMFSERIGLRRVLSRRAFLRIKGATTNVGMRRGRVDDWTAREKADFESIVGSFYDTYDALDYDMAVQPTLWRSDGIREGLEV